MFETKYKLKGTCGDYAFETPAETPEFGAHLKFRGYVKDHSDIITGVKYYADYGIGYEKRNGEKEIVMHPGDTVEFDHAYNKIIGPGEIEKSTIHIKATLSNKEAI